MSCPGNYLNWFKNLLGPFLFLVCKLQVKCTSGCKLQLYEDVISRWYIRHYWKANQNNCYNGINNKDNGIRYHVLLGNPTIIWAPIYYITVKEPHHLAGTRLCNWVSSVNTSSLSPSCSWYSHQTILLTPFESFVTAKEKAGILRKFLWGWGFLLFASCTMPGDYFALVYTPETSKADKQHTVSLIL